MYFVAGGVQIELCLRPRASSSPNISAHPKCLNFVFSHPNFVPNYEDYVFTLILLQISPYKLYTPVIFVPCTLFV